MTVGVNELNWDKVVGTKVGGGVGSGVVGRNDGAIVQRPQLFLQHAMSDACESHHEVLSSHLYPAQSGLACKHTSSSLHAASGARVVGDAVGPHWPQLALQHSMSDLSDMQYSVLLAHVYPSQPGPLLCKHTSSSLHSAPGAPVVGDAVPLPWGPHFPQLFLQHAISDA